MHFLLMCSSLEKGRNYSIINKNIDEPKTRLIDCLFKNKEHQKVGKMIKDMWSIRKDNLKAKKEENKINNNYISYKHPAFSDPGPRRADRRILNLGEDCWDSVGLVFGTSRGVE